MCLGGIDEKKKPDKTVTIHCNYVYGIWIILESFHQYTLKNPKKPKKKKKMPHREANIQGASYIKLN